MFIFHASDYQSRTDLETAVRNKFGLTLDEKEAEIQGTSEDLNRLSLGADSIFWAIPCVQTDLVAEAMMTQAVPVLGSSPDKPTKRRALPTNKKTKNSVKSPKKK